MDVTEESGAQHGLQRLLTHAHQEALRPALRVLVQREEAATGRRGWLLQRFDAGAGYGYGAWLSGSAGARHHSLTDEEYCCAARRHLNLSFPAFRTCPPPRCPFCREQMDEYGAHVLACGKAGVLDNDVHNLVRDHLYAVCGEAGFRPGKETPGLVPGSRQRPADVLLPAGHGLGGSANATIPACLDCCGVRSECATYMASGLTQGMAAAHRTKAERKFDPAPAAYEEAAAKGDEAASQCAAGGGSAAEAEAAREAARTRALDARRPRLHVVPVVFSSCGCWYNGDPSRGVRAVMDTLAAKYKAGESDRPEGSGSAAVHSRWLPRLSTALERGVWWRFRYTLRALRGEFDVDPLTLADLPSYVTGPIFLAAS